MLLCISLFLWPSVVDARWHDHPTPYILIRTSIPALSGRQTVAVDVAGHHPGVRGWLVVDVARPTAVALVKVSASAILLLLLLQGGTVEVVEHQVHVRLLLPLQMFDNSLIFVNFNPDVSVCLPRQSSRLVKHSSQL